MPPDDPDPKRGSGHTGPTSNQGKLTSSLNALKHGACARKVIRTEEDQVNWDILYSTWHDEYRPETDFANKLVYEAVLADWQMEFCTGSYLDVQASLTNISPLDWTEEQHKKLQLFLRYKTAAERQAVRTRAALEHHRRTRKMQAPPAELEHQSESEVDSEFDAEPEPENLPHCGFTQMLTLRVVNGEVRAETYPPLDIMHLIAKECPSHAPVFRLYFIPPEGYPKGMEWLEELHDWGPGEKRESLTFPQWLEQFNEELASGFYDTSGQD